MRRVLVLILAASAALPATAQAQQSPPGCSTSHLALSLDPTPATVRPGQRVDYAVRASNVGAPACDVSLATVDFTPPTGPAVSFGASELPVAPGQKLLGTNQWTAGTTTGLFTAKVVAAGTLHDVAGNPVGGEISRDVTIVDPKLALTLTAVPATGPAPLTVTYHYLLTNLSTPAAALTSPTITHPDCGPATLANGDTDSDGQLDRAEQWELTCTRTFTTAGTYSASAVAGAISTLDNAAVSATAPLTGVRVDLPVSTAHLALTKVASPASGFAPLAVTYRYTVVNDGPSTPISDIAVEDGACAPVTGAANPPLAPNESRVFTCSALLGVGSASSSAVATGIDTVTGTRVNSAAASADVTVSPAPEPLGSPDGPTATPTPAKTPSARVKFRYTGRFTPARACRGTVTLTLKAGTKTVAVKRVKLDRNCRYKVSFDVTRARLGKATKVTVTAKAGKRTASRRLTVPRTR